MRSRAGCGRVVVVGAGNIGAALIDVLARMSALIGEFTVIDHDRYTSDNVKGQCIMPSDVGRPKAAVQRRKIERINPMLKGRVTAVVEDVRNVPVGRLRADVVLACVDSKAVRRHLVRTAWRLGVPVIDAGVSAEESLLARVTTYVPHTDAACIECGWDTRQYETLEDAYPCLGDAGLSQPTNAPASLGMLAAALQALECGKLLSGDVRFAGGREVLLDAAHHRHHVSLLRRNPNCRFDHATWEIERLERGPDDVTVGECLRLVSREGRAAGEMSLSVEGRPFVRKVQCTRCGGLRDVLGLVGRLRPRDRRCGRCGGAVQPMGFHMTERLEAGGNGRLMDRKLHRLGFLPHDVFSVSGPDREEAHYELGDGR